MRRQSADTPQTHSQANNSQIGAGAGVGALITRRHRCICIHLPRRPWKLHNHSEHGVRAAAPHGSMSPSSTFFWCSVLHYYFRIYKLYHKVIDNEDY